MWLDSEKEKKMCACRILEFMGKGQNLERVNLERPIFRNFKITNIKITKDKLFDSFIFEFIFHYS